MKRKIFLLSILIILCLSFKANAMPVLTEKNSVHLKCKISEMTCVSNEYNMTVTITQKGKWYGHEYSFTLSKKEMKSWKAELNRCFKSEVFSYLKKYHRISKAKYNAIKRKYELKKGSACYVLLYKNRTKTVLDDIFINIYKLIK